MTQPYQQTHLPVDQMTLAQVRDPVLVDQRPSAFDGAVSFYRELAGRFTAAHDAVQRVVGRAQAAHSGAAADAASAYLRALAEPGRAAATEAERAAEALLGQNGHAGRALREIASADPGFTLSGALAEVAKGAGAFVGGHWLEGRVDSYIAADAAEYQAAQTHARTEMRLYQDNTNANLGSGFAAFAPPPQPERGAPGAVGGPSGAAPGPVGASGVPTPIAVVPAEAVPTAPGSPGSVPPVPPVPAGTAIPPGAVAPGAPPGAAPSHGALPPHGAPMGANVLPPPSAVTPTTIARGGASRGPRPDAPHPGGSLLGSTAPHRSPGSAPRSAGPSGRPEGAPPGRGGVPTPGPRPGSPGLPGVEGARAVGSSRPAVGGVPFLPGGAGGQHEATTHARASWLLEDDPDAVWFAGLPAHVDPVIGAEPPR
jgi:hypothetical protein